MTPTHLIPRYRLHVVQEEHSPLYGAPRITDARSCVASLARHFHGLAEEHFVVLHLDTKHAPIGYQIVSIGSLSLSIVHPREVFKLACCANAAAIVCAHNHPSSDPTPSQEDRKLTARLVSCGELLGIPVLDHIVIGEADRYVSFADQGWLSSGAQDSTR